MPQDCACSLAAWITIVTCDLVAHISLNCWQINPVWKRKFLLNGQMKCKSRSTKCVCFWLPMLSQPNHNKRFNVYTDTSDFQLGAWIIHKGRPVSYFSWKLTKSQQNYTTIEKEMLSIVATLEEFWSILLGADIHVFMNHKNLTFNALKTQCLLLWHTKN